MAKTVGNETVGNESAQRGPRRGATRAVSRAGRLRKRKRRRLEAVRSPPLLARGDGLEFPSIFVPENERTFVHLAKTVKKYRNIDFLIFILVFEWFEPAVEKGVFYAVD